MSIPGLVSKVEDLLRYIEGLICREHGKHGHSVHVVRYASGIISKGQSGGIREGEEESCLSGLGICGRASVEHWGWLGTSMYNRRTLWLTHPVLFWVCRLHGSVR